MNVFDTITELLTLSKWENIIEQTKVTALVLTNYPRVIYLRGQYSTVPKNGPAVHNDTVVNYKLLKIEQAQTNLKWSILSCNFQK